MADSPLKPSLTLTLAAWAAKRLPLSLKRSLYRIGPLAHLLRRQLNRAVPFGLSEVNVAAGELSGTRLLLDMQSEKDYWLGTYEPDLQATLRQLVQPGMIAYDIGANIGYISLIFSRLVGLQGRVYAFEALPDNLQRLCANLRLNGFVEQTLQPAVNLEQPRIAEHEPFENSDPKHFFGALGELVVVPAAVVDHSGMVDFLVGPSGGMGKAQGSAGRLDISYSQVIQVPGLSLDEFVFQQDYPPPQVVKIDIEGGEVLALPGMARVLEEKHPIILMELHGPQAAQAAWAVLQAANYRVCRMQPGFPPVTSLDALDWKAYLVAF